MRQDHTLIRPREVGSCAVEGTQEVLFKCFDGDFYQIGVMVARRHELHFACLPDRLFELSRTFVVKDILCWLKPCPS